jgi:hypothetical protein
METADSTRDDALDARSRRLSLLGWADDFVGPVEDASAFIRVTECDLLLDGQVFQTSAMGDDLPPEPGFA